MDGAWRAVERIALAAERGGWTVATAESVTGGRVAAALTTRPGATAYFVGGIVAYAASRKVALLDVPPTLLEEQGDVHADVARAMARGALVRCEADWAVGTTGVAGPSRPEGLAEIGTVWSAIASRRPAREGAPADARPHHFEGARDAVTARATEAALEHLADAMEQALAHMR